MKPHLLALILTLIFFSASIFAQAVVVPDLSAGRIDPLCARMQESKTESKAEGGGFDQGLCAGIILGVEDNAHYDQKICIPKNIDLTSRIRVVRDYVQTQPARIQEAFASLAFDAMVKKWPCKSK